MFSRMEEPPSKKFKTSNEANKIEDHPTNKLQLIANENGLSIDSVEFARYMDKIDPLHYLRHEFHYPKMRELYGGELNLIKIRSPHLLPMFYQLFTSHNVGDLKPLL